jgi:hypothetical protein
MRRLAPLFVPALVVAACGSSSASSPSSHSSSTGARPGATSGSPAIRATFAAGNHDPTIIVNWPYTVTVRDAHGHPLSGTVFVEFTFGGGVVGHDPTGIHRLRDGRWHDTLNFPQRSVGIPLTVVAVIHTPIGSTKLLWPVTPKK